MAVTPTLTLRLNPELREALEKLAERDRRKLTQYVQKVLADHVARESHSKKR
jgi:predicted transcriptional regulator